MKKLLLMATHGCHPLWEEVDEHEANPLSPDDFPLSVELKKALRCWASDFDSVTSEENPTTPHFKTEAEKTYFLDRNIALAERLQEELGPEFLIFLLPTSSYVSLAPLLH